jgi:hypothetical protein
MNSRRRVNSTVRQQLIDMPILSLLISPVLMFSSGCSCHEALDNDMPHGANEPVEIRGPVVNNISGTIVFPDDSVAKDAVVELYELPNARPDTPINEIVGWRKRRAACVTATDGTFCFSGLPSGKYLLRAGTRQPNGMNELYMRVTVDHGWFRELFRRSKRLRLGLTLGT